AIGQPAAAMPFPLFSNPFHSRNNTTHEPTSSEPKNSSEPNRSTILRPIVNSARNRTQSLATAHHPTSRPKTAQETQLIKKIKSYGAPEKTRPPPLKLASPLRPHPVRTHRPSGSVGTPPSPRSRSASAAATVFDIVRPSRRRAEPPQHPATITPFTPPLPVAPLVFAVRPSKATRPSPPLRPSASAASPEGLLPPHRPASREQPRLDHRRLPAPPSAPAPLAPPAIPPERRLPADPADPVGVVERAGLLGVQRRAARPALLAPKHRRHHPALLSGRAAQPVQPARHPPALRAPPGAEAAPAPRRLRLAHLAQPPQARPAPSRQPLQACSTPSRSSPPSPGRRPQPHPPRGPSTSPGPPPAFSPTSPGPSCVSHTPPNTPPRPPGSSPICRRSSPPP
ncbi:hypothetical protein PTTG_27765, partial [Puccinia triticina 1-1 BBBD Race 1]